MANLKFAGRKKGTVVNTVINDPILEPFFIVIDQYSYIVNENVESGNNKDNTKKNKIKPIGYFTNFDSALDKVAQDKLRSNKKNYSLISDYIADWKEITNQFKEAIKIK